MATITALNIYPVKSCAGIALTRAALTATGLANDRRWMLVNAQARFLTQREMPKLALITPSLQASGLTLSAPGMPVLSIGGTDTHAPVEVTVWRDRAHAFDEGEQAAEWFSTFLQQSVRLVRFDPAHRRASSRDWTGDLEALNQFSDGYPILAISNASLADLNARLAQPLPMNRFRPNIVLDGLEAYGEDRVHEFHSGAIRLRVVKPCTRCKITTTEQTTGIAQGPEPLATLRAYRWDAALKGVTFGQNLVIVEGFGSELFVGQELMRTGRVESSG